MKSIRLSLLAAAAASVLSLGACNEQGSLPRNSRHYVPISIETQSLMREKSMRTHAPILVRAFKQESELEIWKQDASGKLALLKTYPMCRWSGQLGPKVREGDRQVPEGIYSFSTGSMNPNSSYYLSFNIGYPNAVDRQLGRTGAHIMVHGDCSSMGCFAMTDGQIADIYALTREAFAGGQKEIQIQSFPFRMTAENLAKYRNDPNIGFWRNLKLGDDKFMVTKEPVKVAACNGKYVFGDGTCGGNFDEAVRDAIAAKQKNDDVKVAEVIAAGVKPVKRVYRDGDMHPVFKDQLFAGGAAIGTTRNGVSRTEAVVAFTPIELPVEAYKAHKAKGRSTMQIAELAQQEKLNEPAQPPRAEPAKVEVAKVETPARPQQPTTAAATRPATAASSAAASAAALAPEPAQPAAPSVFSRMMGAVGLGSTEASAPAATVEESRNPVNIPLPPRRQATGPAAPGPQANATSPLPPVVGPAERLAPSALATGFVKAQ
jgi:murein L,D-transpeptidase YafK